MKKDIMKRIGSYLVDIFILSFVFSLITYGFKSDNVKVNKEMNDLLNKVEKEEIEVSEFQDKLIDINYQVQKNNFSINILMVFLYSGYFIFFAFFNGGQTIGKKLFKIKVVNNKRTKLTLSNMLFRSLFIYGITSTLFSIVFINILPKETFIYSYAFVSYIENMFMMVSIIMVLFRKDGRGLHDLIGRTNVVEEVR